jgi:hypothetical protein
MASRRPTVAVAVVLAVILACPGLGTGGCTR